MHGTGKSTARRMPGMGLHDVEDHFVLLKLCTWQLPAISTKMLITLVTEEPNPSFQVSLIQVQKKACHMLFLYIVA